MPLVRAYFQISRQEFLALPHWEAQQFLESLEVIEARQAYSVLRGASLIMGDKDNSAEALWEKGHKPTQGKADKKPDWDTLLESVI